MGLMHTLSIFGIEEQYEYLGNGSGSMTSLPMIIIGIFIGLALASFGAVFNKRVLGDFVRKLLREDVLSAESAKTLAELNYQRNPAIRSGVRKGVTLRRVVRCREEEEYLAAIEAKQIEYEEKRKNDPSLPRFKAEPFRVDPDQHHFYIPEEIKYMADVKFEKKGSTWLGAVVFIVVLAIAFVLLMWAMPYILSVLNDWIGWITGAGSSANTPIT